MAMKIVTFSKADSEWLPKIGDYDTLIFRYAIIDSEHFGKPEEKNFVKEQSVEVKISRTTQKSWGLIKPDTNLDKVLFQYALDLVSRKVKEGSLLAKEEVVLFNNAPGKCPYDPEKIDLKFGAPLEFEENRPLGFKLP